MQELPFQRSACQPSPYILPRVERPRVGLPLTVILLGLWRGVYGHWQGGRSFPCLHPACELHSHELIWWGFCPALMFRSAKGPYTPCIAEITEHAAMMLAGVDLRGCCVTLSREAHRRDARVRAELLDVHADPKSLPGPFDVEPILRRMWKCGPLPVHQAPPILPTVHKVSTITLRSYAPQPESPAQPLEERPFRKAARRMAGALAGGMES